MVAMIYFFKVWPRAGPRRRWADSSPKPRPQLRHPLVCRKGIELSFGLTFSILSLARLREFKSSLAFTVHMYLVGGRSGTVLQDSDFKIDHKIHYCLLPILFNTISWNYIACLLIIVLILGGECFKAPATVFPSC